MKVKPFMFNPWQENCYVVYDDSGECAIIDAGCYSETDQKTLISFIEANQLTIKYVLNTHLHIDHILGNSFLYQKYEILPLGHDNDEFLIENAREYATQIGIPMTEEPPKLGGHLDEGDAIDIGNFRLKIFHIPGHSPGSLAYYNEEEDVIFTGDILFYESIGRTDLIYGNMDALVSGIRKKLFVLPEPTKVYPGHGPVTSIGHELLHNPFLRNQC